MSDKIDFICIGAQRCGTTWLYKCCKNHPDLSMAKQKELHFFDSQMDKGRKIKRYHSYFEWKSNKLRGDIEPSYCVFYERCAPRIYEYNPAAKLILLIRHPVDRLISHYKWELYRTILKDKPGSKYYLNRKIRLIEFFNKNFKLCRTRGLYTKQIEGFLQIFPRDQLLITTLDDISERPKETLRAIFNFLNVKNIENKDIPNKVRMQELMKQYNEARNKIANHMIKKKLVTTKKPEYNKIESFYRDEIQKLKDDFNITLSRVYHHE